MKTTIERLGDDTLRLDVEVPATVVREAIDHTLVELSREMRVPGFRPGKIPPQMVLARVGKEAAAAEAVSAHIGTWYVLAVQSSGIRPIAEPEIDVSESPDVDKPFQFSATVQVAPKPKLPDIKTLEVRKPKAPDTREYFDRVMEATLQAAATLEPTGAPAKDGDEVVVDFSCTVDGAPVAGASAVGYEARLGGGRLLDELEAAILGHSAGEELEIPVNFESDHPIGDLAGNNAVFHLKLREVSHTVLPELTDDVARQISEFDTAKELTDHIESSIRERLDRDVQGIFRGNAVKALADASEVNVPPRLVENRASEMYMAMKRQVEGAGQTMESYLASSGREMSDVMDELQVEAEDDVKRELCLSALVEEADIAVSDDDLRAEIKSFAEEAGRDPDELAAEIFASSRVEALRSELSLSRAIDYLVANARAVEVESPDSSGTTERNEP